MSKQVSRQEIVYSVIHSKHLRLFFGIVWYLNQETLLYNSPLLGIEKGLLLDVLQRGKVYMSVMRKGIVLREIKSTYDKSKSPLIASVAQLHNYTNKRIQVNLTIRPQTPNTDYQKNQETKKSVSNQHKFTAFLHAYYVHMHMHKCYVPSLLHSFTFSLFLLPSLSISYHKSND